MLKWCNRFVFGLVLSVGFLKPNAAKAEASDSYKENALHQRYLKFGQSPTSAEKWGQLSQQLKAETYVVQKGDTLWDISETFFADPEFWPKIWSLNKESIFNPHEIEPGDTLYFVPGSMSEPPKVSTQLESVKPTSLTEKPIAKPILVKEDLKNIKVPPATMKSSSPIAVPQSLPSWNIRHSSEVGEIDLQSRRTASVLQQYPLLGFVHEGNLENLPEVFEAEDVSSMKKDASIILIQGSNLGSEGKAQVVRDLGVVKTDSSDVAHEGNVLSVEAEITLLGPGPDGKYRARVDKSYSPIGVGSKVIFGEIEIIRAQNSSLASAIETDSEVIGGTEGATREIFGPGEFLFLNQGTNGGAQVGQILKIFQTHTVQDRSKSLPAPKLIGYVQIVRVTTHFSTALVLSAQAEIRVGDSTSPVAHRKND